MIKCDVGMKRFDSVMTCLKLPLNRFLQGHLGPLETLKGSVSMGKCQCVSVYLHQTPSATS